MTHVDRLILQAGTGIAELIALEISNKVPDWFIRTNCRTKICSNSD